MVGVLSPEGYVSDCVWTVRTGQANSAPVRHPQTMEGDCESRRAEALHRLGFAEDTRTRWDEHVTGHCANQIGILVHRIRAIQNRTEQPARSERGCEVGHTIRTTPHARSPSTATSATSASPAAAWRTSCATAAVGGRHS